MKRKIRITENDLHRIIENAVYQVLAEQNNRVDEGWKGLAMAGMMGAASLFGGQKANAQNYHYQENPIVNGVERVDDKSQKYDITYDNEQNSTLIYELLRNNAQYRNKMTPDVIARIQKYPQYNQNMSIENFLKSNQALIKRCGGHVGGINSDVTFVCYNNVYYLVPSDMSKL